MIEEPLNQTPLIIPPQPLRLNLQCSMSVGSEAEATALYEEISTFVKGVKPSAMTHGGISKMLSPCCGDKKP